jgi:antibiotic biosynthesis monooxygenase
MAGDDRPSRASLLPVAAPHAVATGVEVGAPLLMHVRFRAHPGRGDELAAVLVGAAASLGAVDACQLYLVSRVPDDAEAISVTEVWADSEAHTACWVAKTQER